MIDSEVMARADGGLHAAQRVRLARHQGRQPWHRSESNTLLGACHPRTHLTPESTI